MTHFIAKPAKRAQKKKHTFKATFKTQFYIYDVTGCSEACLMPMSKNISVIY
jgi:hypothetical protein